MRSRGGKRSRDIASTSPQDWTLYAAQDGKVIGCLRDSGGRKVAPWYGISISNHRGVDGQKGIPTRTTETKTIDGEEVEVEVLEMLADVRRGDMLAEGVYMCVRSDDHFIGRTNRQERLGGPRRQDLRACLRTMTDTKCIRVITGLNKVPGPELVESGIDLALCHHGHGYGTSGQRQGERAATKTAEKGVPELAETFWNELTKRTAGSDVSPQELLLDCTKVAATDKRKAFDGRKSHKSFTAEWQLKAAWAGLKRHEIFGDAAMKEEAGS